MSKLGVRTLSLLPPEKAHEATIRLLRSPLAPRPKVVSDPMLVSRLAGIELPNPLGLAAGFDKNAEVPDKLLRLGFGFVEVGAVTPKPQAGNAKPRVFRLRKDEAVINRYGFNNDGLEVIGGRLAARAGKPGVVGINLGANKDSDDRAEDYVKGLMALEEHVAFLTVNVSSPNTQGLRDLQGKTALSELLGRVLRARRTQKPVFVKVAPDLTDEDKADILDAAREAGIDGLIVSNTTLSRAGVSGPDAHQKGGLSGKPLFERSTAVLRDFAAASEGRMPLIGVGGIASAEDVLIKIKNGASAVQLYTALVYQGPGMAKSIIETLPELLRRDGFPKVADAVGAAL
jgi:dihydroorotate dehydrogenase